MRVSNTSTLVSRMIALAAAPDTGDVEDTRPAASVKRIFWTTQAAALRSMLPAATIHQIECRVAAELEAMALPEIFFTTVEACGRVITCDLDEAGTATIFALIDPQTYDDLVEDAGDDALFGVDCDGVYVTPARTRH
ncbi:hypothetical protein [Azospirillum halopraeferens]|uniref:hypothetical protein n=1 Tax=Azospirillum halopraeferens TaxID=34010 RepID=UPI0004219741|nr:hypothetical protein [Azospirillum halopraeferens]